MMKLEISVFKDTGKWYASAVVESEKDIPLYAQEFKEFIKSNLPARYGDGYVVIRDLEDGEGFHNCLLRYNELI